MRGKFFSNFCAVAAVLACAAAVCFADEKPRFGACAHPVRGHEFPIHEPMLDGYRDCGLKILRTDMDWPAIERNGTYSFEKFDKVFDYSLSRGVSVLGIITGRLNGSEDAFNATEKWTKYISATVAHFKGRVEDWEIINEVDWGSWIKKFKGDVPKLAAEYARVLRAAHGAVKKANPSARVFFSGVAQIKGKAKFIEEVYKADPKIAECFDVMNVHRYYGYGVPEDLLRDDLTYLDALMKQYGGAKPVWLTETGCNSAPVQKTAADIVRMSLERLGIKIDGRELAVIRDPAFNCSTDMILDWPHQVFPEIKKFKTIKFSDFENLDPNKTKAILLPPMSLFAQEHVDKLRAYVAMGGTIVSIGGTPACVRQIADENGHYKHQYFGGNAFRVAVRASWRMREKNPDFPKYFETRDLVAEKGFEALKPEGAFSSDTLLLDKLGKQDKFIPIMGAKFGGEVYPLAGIVNYGGDMSGNLIMISSRVNSNGSEKYQAALLPRYVIAALANGVDVVLNYSYHSNGLYPDAEGHFGITRYDLSRKPAWHSYKLVAELLGAKAKPELKIDGNVAVAQWVRAEDGLKVKAIWKLCEVEEITVAVKTDKVPQRLATRSGKDKKLPKSPEFELKLSFAPTYIFGVDKLEYKVVSASSAKKEASR